MLFVGRPDYVPACHLGYLDAPTLWCDHVDDMRGRYNDQKFKETGLKWFEKEGYYINDRNSENEYEVLPNEMIQLKGRL